MHIKTFIKKRSTYQIHPDNETNVSTAVNPSLVWEVRVHGTTFHQELLVQRNNNIVIWIVIHLFTFHFFRESYCLCPLWNKLRSKTASCHGGKKHHSFVAYSLTDRMRPSKKIKVKDTLKIVYLNSGAPSWRCVTHAVTHLSSDGGVT